MGWLLFREGKAAQAESYIVAAQMNEPNEEVKGHVEEVRKALHRTNPAEPDPGSQQARTVNLGSWKGMSGTAEYKMVLMHGRVFRSEAAGSKTLNNAEEMLKEADLSRFFPAESEVKLVKNGVVNCVAGKCQLIIEP